MRADRLLPPLAAAAAAAWLLTGVLWAFGLLEDASPRASIAQAAEPPARPATKSAETVTIGWVGDITPGSKYGALPGDGRSLFAATRGLLREPDVMVGNLEGTLSTGGSGKCGAAEGNGRCFAFQARPETARGLRWAGFDVLNLANNHAFDYGAEGMGQTIAALDRAKIAHTGRPGEIASVRRRGLRIAFVGFAPYPWAASLLDPVAAAALVKDAAGRADVVVALAHLGGEGTSAATTPDGPEAHLGEPRGDAEPRPVR